MRVLVTGGLGYIGSHTAVELIGHKDEVVIVDNLYNANRDVVERIQRITGVKPVFYEGDCCDEKEMQHIFDREKIDCVIHFAGYKAVGESVQKPLMYYDNNLQSAIVVLRQMEKHGVNTFVFSSSATVYSAECESPLVEGMPLGATNPYGWTKVMIEQIVRDFCTVHPSFTGVLLRYFNPIGAHASGLIGELPVGVPNNLMPYICQVADGTREMLHVFGDDYDTVDGTGVRDYIHVCDLASGHLAALVKKHGTPGCFAYNLGTGKGTSVLELVHAFEKANNLQIPYQVDPRRPGDNASVFADAKLANQELDWKAERSIEEACASSWAFQRGLKK